jgi:DNA-directed RNA polymerase beta' subunit
MIFSYIWKIFSFISKIDFQKNETFSLQAKRALYSGISLLKFSQTLTIEKIEDKNFIVATCKCGKSKIYIKYFFSVFRTCRFCIHSTRYPYYGRIKHCWISKDTSNYNYFQKIHFTKQERFILLELVGSEYQPGFCECGRTSTEIPWEKSAFCGYCGTEISIEILPRRYKLGYLPLSTPIAHFWYYYYEPHPLYKLTNFSRRLFIILINSETIIAEEACFTIMIRKQNYSSLEFNPNNHFTNLFFKFKCNRFSKVEKPFRISTKIKTYDIKNEVPSVNIKNRSKLLFPKVEICTFPWYCLYRSTILPQDVKDNKIDPFELFNTLLVGTLTKEDYFHNAFNITLRQSPNRKNLLQEKLGIRKQANWIVHHPIRTGGELIFNRLKILDQKNWCLQAHQRLKYLNIEMKTFEKYGSLDKNEVSMYRQLVRIRNQLLIRIRILTEIQLAKLRSQWLILQCLPILPPDLRPILSLGKGKVIVADANSLYRCVIERNIRVAQRRRIKEFYKDNYNRDLFYHERLLQEALACLFENNIKRNKREKDSKKRVYKSLAEALKGKRGRFRNNLLGKRVDYSGRSVIISGPELSLYQCGLPREIVLILFQPFLIRFLMGRIQNGEKIQTRFQARHFIEQETNIRWNRRKQVLSGFPVLLNRAPTLHRFGFQAFQPKLTNERAIQLHPLSCSGFNADFDGDQMAVHVPLSPHARAEAWRFIIPGSHFFSPATSEIVFAPSQDIILGIYYLTIRRTLFSIFCSFHHIPGFRKDKLLNTNKKKWKSPLLFLSKNEIINLFEKGYLALHQIIWLYTQTLKVEYDSEVSLHEVRLNSIKEEQICSLWHWKKTNPTTMLIRTIVGRVIFSSIL